VTCGGGCGGPARDLNLGPHPYQLSRAHRHADQRVPCSPDSRSGEVMCSRPPGSRAGCQGRSSSLRCGRSTLTAGHRCPTRTTIPGRACWPVAGGGGVLPRTPSSCGDGRIATRVYRGDRWNVTGDSGRCHGRFVTCRCVTIRSLPRTKDTQKAPSHGASFSFWKGVNTVPGGLVRDHAAGCHRRTRHHVAHRAYDSQAPQPWLIIDGTVLGGFIAPQWRRTH
jgi:hypothetical protein